MLCLRRVLLLVPLSRLLFGGLGQAYAQDWPTKPVRLIVAFAPGAQPDITARLLAERLARALGRPDANQRASGAGIELRYLAPDALAALVKQEIAFWGNVIRVG